MIDSTSTFRRGKTGTYEIVVTNSGEGPTSGPVNVAVTLPIGLSYSAYNAPGWTFNRSTLTFTQKKSLQPGTIYPKITLIVQISQVAPSSFAAKATVSGGNSVSNTATHVTSISTR